MNPGYVIVIVLCSIWIARSALQAVGFAIALVQAYHEGWGVGIVLWWLLWTLAGTVIAWFGLVWGLRNVSP